MLGSSDEGGIRHTCGKEVAIGKDYEVARLVDGRRMVARSDNFSLWRSVDDAPGRRIVAVSWRKNYERMAGGQSESLGHRARARGAPSRILLAESSLHTSWLLALGVKLCRKKSESAFFSPVSYDHEHKHRWLRSFRCARALGKSRDVKSLEKSFFSFFYVFSSEHFVRRESAGLD